MHNGIFYLVLALVTVDIGPRQLQLGVSKISQCPM